MAKSNVTKVKLLSEKAQQVLDRILAGEVPTQYVVTGSPVRGCPAGKHKAVFPNGEAINGGILNTLQDRGLIEKKMTSKFGTWGYTDKKYSLSPAGKVPETEAQSDLRGVRERDHDKSEIRGNHRH